MFCNSERWLLVCYAEESKFQHISFNTISMHHISRPTSGLEIRGVKKSDMTGHATSGTVHLGSTMKLKNEAPCLHLKSGMAEHQPADAIIRVNKQKINIHFSTFLISNVHGPCPASVFNTDKVQIGRCSAQNHATKTSWSTIKNTIWTWHPSAAQKWLSCRRPFETGYDQQINTLF